MGLSVVRVTEAMVFIVRYFDERCSIVLTLYSNFISLIDAPTVVELDFKDKTYPDALDLGPSD